MPQRVPKIDHHSYDVRLSSTTLQRREAERFCGKLLKGRKKGSEEAAEVLSSPFTGCKLTHLRQREGKKA